MTEITAPQKTYALVVGIEKYGDSSIPDVKGPACDAIKFTTWLCERGIPKENISLCISSLDETQGKNEERVKKLGLVYQESTREKIDELLTEILPKKTGELLVVFWVGHGIIDCEKGERRLFFAGATTSNGKNLHLESLLQSLRSDYFQIKQQICIIDACAYYLSEQLRPIHLGGTEIPCGSNKIAWKQLVFLSAREGEKSKISKERGTSHFCEELQKELSISCPDTWPPQMELIASKLEAIFAELRNQKELKIKQTPILFVDFQPYHGGGRRIFEKDSSQLLVEAVKESSQAARDALNPRYLQRISRLADHNDPYLHAIEDSVQRKAKAIFIYAPAGYGKSVLLGEIYDKLIANANNSWVALTLCAYLAGKSIDSIENFAESIGESICLKKVSINQIAERLTDSYGGRGVLLMDTLDLVLNNELIPNLRGLLLKLLEVGVTVVFTCREEEYNFLRNSPSNLAGCAVDHRKVEEFSELEIKEAASIFIENKKELKRQQNKEREIDNRIFDNFAEQIFQVAAGESQAGDLQKILRSPLFLGMLCEVFTDKGTVPLNLTVSNLYDKYWEEKVEKPRENQLQSDAERKQRLCLDIAKNLFEIFREEQCLQESIDKNDLAIDWNDRNLVDARENLISDGVLEWVGSGKSQLRFFHQTLLEYVLACWLKLREARSHLQALLIDLKNKDWAEKQLYWYVIIRQLLTIESYEKFQLIFAELDIKKQPPAFRAAVFAAASRNQPSALQDLLKLGIELDSHQNALIEAVVSVSIELVDPAYEFFLDVIETGQIRAAVNAAKASSAMVNQWWGSLSPRVKETLVAISKREVVNSKNKLDAEHRSDILGSFLREIKIMLEKTLDNDVLQVLREYHHIFGDKSLSFLIQIHLNSQVNQTAKISLLKLLVEQPVPKKLPIQEDMLNLAKNIFSDLVEANNSLLLDSSWLLTLNPNLKKLPKGWDKIQSQAVGIYLAKNNYNHG
jgi:Caspase domain